MSILSAVKCDICDHVGYLNSEWRTLSDFAYIKHACPKCVENTDDYGGDHLLCSRLSLKIRNKLNL